MNTNPIEKNTWNQVSIYQKLTEAFIREYKDEVNWKWISIYQELSEDFMREFKDRLNWAYISKYQELCEYFIREFKDNVDWIYVSSEIKVKALDDTGLYEIVDDYLYGYKAVMSNMRSQYDFNILYDAGKVFNARANANCDEDNSFGLSFWNKTGALNFYRGGLLLKVRAKIEDVKALVHKGHKVRCGRLEILEVVE